MVLETEKDGDEASSSNFFSTIFPGRKAIVSTATLALFPSGEELAQLLCHEIAHVLLNHRREVHSQGDIWTPVLFTLIFLDIKMLVGQVAILYGLERWWYKGVGEKREIEADRLGMRLAVKAGYVSGGASRAWKRLEGMQANLPPKSSVVCRVLNAESADVHANCVCRA
ncbi:hypothetical protein DL98DRAFT_468715 [Cadophora sp. DSE1049]|nr:hypothetical protein DL98DRAFT_468715 [Cadophora sp. DSE1049]